MFFEFTDPDEERDTGFNGGFGEKGFVVEFIDELFFGGWFDDIIPLCEKGVAVPDGDEMI